MHGRKPAFPTVRALARSYLDPYVDFSGRVRAFGVANMVEAMPGYDWRLSEKNVWRVEQMLIDWPHRKIKSSTARYHRLRRWYRAYRKANDDRKPIDYRGKEKWAPLPAAFR